MEKLLSGGRGGRLIPDLCRDLSAMPLLVPPPQLKFQLLPECSLDHLPCYPPSTGSIRPTFLGSHISIASAPPNLGLCLAHPHILASIKGRSTHQGISESPNAQLHSRLGHHLVDLIVGSGHTVGDH